MREAAAICQQTDRQTHRRARQASTHPPYISRCTNVTLIQFQVQCSCRPAQSQDSHHNHRHHQSTTTQPPSHC
ncbi:hypothetical protein E2C01_077840 [Portunus trituberculatus]|uniref:Uncharacterized protein n=1 Tax=Portunus trituberculatus TaxID=210409 RepID=A0A5B7ILB4_PORTR|nr:hypothetical protein [Portunus trituberculatus]